MTEKEDVRSEHPSNKDEVECGWCGKTFKSDEEMTAYEKEGLHRAKQHINADENIEKPDETHDKSIVDEWKQKNERGGKA